ncbi:MAG: Gx transporter family protein [bacterium]
MKRLNNEQLYLISRTKKLAQIAVLVSLATVLNTLENTYLPPMFPWLRIGLANIVTLIAIILFGIKGGVVVAGLRSVLSSLLRGSLFSPAFILGFSGGVISAIVMAIFYKVGKKIFSFIGISIIGAVANNLTQIVVAYFILIKHSGCFYLVPLFLLSSLVTGFFNGVVVIYLNKQLQLSAFGYQP